MKKLNVTVNGITFEVEVELIEEATAHDSVVTQSASPSFHPSPNPVEHSFTKPAPKPINAAGSKKVLSPMNGKILAIKVAPGDSVKSGQVIIEMEAMKMKTNIYAPNDGIVKAISVNLGGLVESGQMLIEFE